MLYKYSPIYHLQTLLTTDNIVFYCSNETGIVSIVKCVQQSDAEI